MDASPFESESINSSGQSSLLAQSDSQQSQILAALPGLLWISNAAGETDFIGPQWSTVTGLPPSSFIGVGWLDVVHPEDREMAGARWMAAVTKPQEFVQECRLQVRGGQYHWFSHRATPILNATDGRVERWIGLSVDIEDLKQSQQALQASERRYSALFENKTYGIAHLRVMRDATGCATGVRIDKINDTYTRITGLSAQQVEGKLLTEVFPGIQYAEFDYLGTYDNVARNGEERSFVVDFHYLNQWLAVYAYRSQPDECIAIFSDITAQKKAEIALREAAEHDLLTGLPNRSLIFEYTRHLLAAANRKHSRGAILFIDLDRFKPVNDQYGHEAGDELLRQVAKRMLACVRQEDMIGRIGGDEFVIVLPTTHKGYSAPTVAQHVVEALSRPFQLGAISVSISASIGISLYPQHGSDVDTLLHAADLAMYYAKESGRNGYHVYTPSLRHRAHATSFIEAQLREAFSNHRLLLHYQPVIDIKSSKMIGAEALLRLPSGAGEPIGPEHFIPVAESCGMIAHIGDWVVAEVCRQLVAWRALGLPPLVMSINISPLQFRQRGFAQRLLAIVKHAQIDAGTLQIEVTENALMDGIDEAITTLDAIHAAGIRIALDDFGTGCSSLRTLSQLPLDSLKVDQAFVQHLSHDRASQAIAEAILAIGHRLDLAIVGEGVESEQDYDYLRQHGCDQVQGNLFSQPLPAAAFVDWYRNWTMRPVSLA